jgi:hypothetical protein
MILVAAVFVAFALSSQPIIAGNSAVEPTRPSIYLTAGSEQCQRVSHLPQGADRMKLVVAEVSGGARDLRIEISDERGALTAGDLKPARTGKRLIKLRPITRAAHRASLCFSNAGPGQIVLGGDVKRNPATPKGKKVEKRLIASAIFLRPGSSSGFSQTGTIVDRFANSQTGVTGGWTLWVAILCAVGAALIALWFVVIMPGRRA